MPSSLAVESGGVEAACEGREEKGKPRVEFSKPT